LLSATWCIGYGRLMANPNFQLLVDAAELLRPILQKLVFVGGCSTALLITDKAAADVRPTLDVDAIAQITSYREYAKFSEKLKAERNGRHAQKNRFCGVLAPGSR